MIKIEMFSGKQGHVLKACQTWLSNNPKVKIVQLAQSMYQASLTDDGDFSRLLITVFYTTGK